MRVCVCVCVFPKIRGTVFWGPYNKDLILLLRVLYSGHLFTETPLCVRACVCVCVLIIQHLGLAKPETPNTLSARV